MRTAGRNAMHGALMVLATGMLVQPALAAPEVLSISDREVRDIAVEAYVYGYPLVLMEVTRRVMTNVAEPTERGAPINQFYHMRAIPDATFTDVVRPNADTLYSTLWFDVEKEPLVISVPDSDGRYYLLPMLDMWTDIFASPGKRTTGTGAQTFAIVGPSWRGVLPRASPRFASPRSSAGSSGVRRSTALPTIRRCTRSRTA